MRNTTMLRQFLRSLCHNKQWDYAVFWKLKQETRTVLTWEDGYFDDAKARIKLEDTLSDGSLHVNRGMISFVDFNDAQYRNCTSHPIKVSLANMKCHHYSLGEGVVGKVALTQRHSWIFADELKSEDHSDSCEDWQLQLAANIKTILLVPVACYGVVQLGSLETVVEDTTLVFHVKYLFSALYHDSENSDSSDSGINRSNISSLVNVPSLTNSSTSIFSSFNSSQVQQPWTIDSNTLPFFMVDHNSPSSVNILEKILDTDTILDIDEDVINARCNYLWLASTEEPQYCSHPNTMPEGDTFDLLFAENETKISLPPEPLDCISISDKEQYGYDLSAEDITYKESEKNYASKTNSLVNDRFLSFPIDSELHKALGITSMEEYDGCFLNTTVPVDVGPINSITTFQGVVSECHDHTFDESNSWLIKENETEYLFDAMVSSLLCGSDDDTFDGKSLRSFSENLSERLVDSSPRENKSESSVVDISSILPTSQQRSTSVSKPNGFMSSISSCNSFCESTNEDNYNHMARGPYGRKLAVINKRGVRNGNSHKPRPRDRQLIQERVKELRELIPNGSKCSIDALLDRTVSHLVFLQRISSQAEKLKRTADTEAKSEVCGSVKPQTQANGANSACEEGRQPEFWPIQVENLDQPGQILIEVQCNDYELFLEIAHVIRRLELTILKGVLESRSNKLWAHFIIEASKGFHRTHILLPLMQLLQRKHAPMPRKF
ncbi:hypothetical protein MUK42_03892 [Musa troglodytarum]|uniref:BHLH domain-containing protein n=1 Tax=Musa troglodytarum TaxID=320322 RepID=A0A9E7GD78_9LILI|nr:hypothetical protein MUK42_03892 [Musa troglodytarum]